MGPYLQAFSRAKDCNEATWSKTPKRATWVRVNVVIQQKESTESIQYIYIYIYKYCQPTQWHWNLYTTICVFKPKGYNIVNTPRRWKCRVGAEWSQQLGKLTLLPPFCWSSRLTPFRGVTHTHSALWVQKAGQVMLLSTELQKWWGISSSARQYRWF